MKNIIKNLRNVFIATLFVGALVACEDKGYDDYDQGAVPTVSMNGEWLININDAASGEVYITHALHKMYELNGQVWITDRIGSSTTDFTGWYLETPLDVNLGTLTFSASERLNTADDSNVTITNGQIFKNAVIAPSGTVTDSIYFKGTFDYDPETVLEFSGYKRTGFEEDE